jgi:uncharacterized membrane protein
MDKIRFSMEDKKTVLVFGSVLFGIEVVILAFFFIIDSSLAAKVLSMISANHLAGRMAFIGIGLELGLPVSFVIFVIILYNTTYLMILNSLIVYFWDRTQKIKVIHNYVSSIKKKAEIRSQFLKKWRWIGIALFVWLPFHMTGAVMGSVIAYIEGYNIRKTLLIVLPSMWLGVFCWGLWFDDLYALIDRFGRGQTLLFTIILIALPLLVYLVSLIKKSITNKV